jgi:hypothetical protein
VRADIFILVKCCTNKAGRLQYNTFEDYCRERCGIERRRAYQLMEATAVLENMKNFTQLPEKESCAAHTTSGSGTTL